MVIKNLKGNYPAYQPFPYISCQASQSEDHFHEDCYWFSTEKDMNATIPYCAKSDEYSIVSCPKNCKYYISHERITELANQELRKRVL